MSTKIVSFYCKQQTDQQDKTVVKFESVQNGFEVNMMLFSTAQNRNHSYFQVSDLLKWSNKLESILTNLNHNLSLSGGKYLGNLNRWTKIWGSFNNGDLEIWGTFRTEDPLVISKKDQITAPSIELLVDERDIIKDDKGEYFITFDWVGVALLLGVPAGSGGARLVDIHEYDLAQFPDLKNRVNHAHKETPTHKEITSLLENQKQQLINYFDTRFLSFQTDLQTTLANLANTQQKIVPTETIKTPDEKPEQGTDLDSEHNELYKLQQIEQQVDQLLKKRNIDLAQKMAAFEQEELVDNTKYCECVSNTAAPQQLPSFFRKLSNN